MLDPDFVADCPYEPEAILIDDVLEVDREKSLIVASMPTHDRLPLTAHQRVHPERHPRHVAAGAMIHLTGMLGYAHAYFVLDLRGSDGWVGYGTNIKDARYGRLATIGPPLRVSCWANRVRRLRDNLYVKYGFKFEQDGTIVYESEQAAVWRQFAVE